ncbi:hypothetical protein E2C01_000336 [Portunus trituberculatus]|uniref:Uncharacterized protein n=1 Tax=Portunus trituberculatus TaxID=210409 RepID=A0A5B7CE22_PORTR|nr:hypothetical protein [Portunus trituberculatus]
MKRKPTAEACGPAQVGARPFELSLVIRICSVLVLKVLPLLKGEPNQRFLTTPNLRHETGYSCSGRRKVTRCTEEFDPASHQLCLNTWCYPGREDALPRCTYHTGFGLARSTLGAI